MEERLTSRLARQWEKLLREGQELDFKKGQVLFYEGHAPYGVFVVGSGEVRFKRGERPCAGNHLWSSPSGKVLGLDHFFDDTPYCCTCLAATDCTMTFISKSQLMAVAPHPSHS